tara:strand:- start:270 stop:1229 length:960 start_codon:yes stop_codon:yes gene_type:complete
MVMPSGPTNMRGGRGIALRGGGTNPSNAAEDTMDKIVVATTGNSVDFGNLVSARTQPSSASSSIRAFFFGGTAIPAITSNISSTDYTSGGGGNDFGDLTQSVRALSNGCGDQIRAVRMGGYGSGVGGAPSPAISNVIDFFIMASGGDASDFGDLNVNSGGQGQSYTVHNCASPTRGIAYGGANAIAGDIQFITFATKGDSQTFGECTVNQNDGGALSDTTRGIQIGAGSPVSDVIEFITMASEGNGTDFGNLTSARGTRGASNATRGLGVGGYDGSGQTNTIDFITIQSTGNATDFGDLTTQTQQQGATSDIHGGLGAD